MKLTKLFLIALSITLFASCSNDDNDSEAPKGIYNDGVFVLNEGNSEGGSVSFISDNFTNFTQDIYATVNGNDFIGKYLQSIFFDGDNAYIISSGSNIINVVNRYTFALEAKIETGLTSPRYGVAKNGKAYVTNANTYAYSNPETGNTDDFIAVIDLATNKVESTIALNTTANKIMEKDGKLYITEPYNNTKLLVVDIVSKSLETPIEVGLNADSLEEENGIIYVLRNPYGDRSEIVKVKLSDKSVSKITFPETLDNANFLDIEDNKIYYTVENSVYAINKNETTVSTTPILTATLSNSIYGFAVNNNKIYISDSGDFSSSSKAYIYSLTGSLQKELTVGIGPNGFYFN